MYEVELKIRADHERVRDRLADRDADRLEQVMQVDTYYDAPHREFAETDEALRVRREHHDEETAARLTYKGPLVEAESKTREEIEATIANGDDVSAIFEALGFEPAATVRKDRTRFHVDGLTVTLDAVGGLGEFIEVETEVETEADVESAREDAAALLRDLDLDPDEQIRTSYLGLLLEADG
jgi:adenylyl cyclase CyaB, putative